MGILDTDPPLWQHSYRQWMDVQQTQTNVFQQGVWSGFRQVIGGA